MFYKKTEQLILNKDDDGLWYIHMPADAFNQRTTTDYTICIGGSHFKTSFDFNLTYQQIAPTKLPTTIHKIHL
jgi:hypothetical protein